MVELLSHEVRSGELTWGPFVHYATFFDLLIRATEELSHELDYAAEAIVEAAYEFRRAATGDVCIRADLAYGCFDAYGERTPFPAEAIGVVSGA